MKLEAVSEILRHMAPEETALENDPVGLLMNPNPAQPIARIGVCLDADPETVQRAVIGGIQLLITHHPLLYHPLKRIHPLSDPIAQSVRLLIKADMALYAMHTNWDRAAGGINDTLAAELQLTDISPLGNAGAAALPRIGTLAAPRPLADFARFVETTLDCCGPNALRCCGPNPDAMIARVAVCGGAGAFLIPEVIAAGAHAYVTSDVRHHEFIDAAARQFPLLDAGHGATETPGMHALVRHLAHLLPHDVSVSFF